MYLAEEVLAGLPSDIANALLNISILPRFCEAVTGIKGLVEKISNVPSVNLLMQRIDEQGRWLRIHPVLIDVLKQRLEKSFDKDYQSTLYQKASLWCEDNGRTFSAIEYAINADNIDRAIS